MAATKLFQDMGKQTRDRIAELVAEGHSVTSCADILGIHQSTVWKRWREIKRGLGWQAQ